MHDVAARTGAYSRIPPFAGRGAIEADRGIFTTTLDSSRHNGLLFRRRFGGPIFDGLRCSFCRPCTQRSGPFGERPRPPTDPPPVDYGLRIVRPKSAFRSAFYARLSAHSFMYSNDCPSICRNALLVRPSYSPRMTPQTTKCLDEVRLSSTCLGRPTHSQRSALLRWPRSADAGK